MSILPLSGVRVTDFCWVGAGPFFTKMLADHGAEVIKVESGNRPDNLRNSPPFRGKGEGLNRSGYFASRNTSKYSFALDMKHPRALEVAKRLIALSDIVSNSFTPGTLDRWGLSYEAVVAIRPDIIYVSMPMQGETGPRKHDMGFGSTISALCGLNHLTGFPDREPIGTGTNYPDHLPNPGHATVAVLAALWYRRRTGKGQRIELAQTEATINAIGPAVMQASFTGVSPVRAGNSHPIGVPHGVYPCQGEDRWCAVAVFGRAEWDRFVDAMGRPEWALETAYQTDAGRRENARELDGRIGLWTAQWDAYDLTDHLQGFRIAAHAVQSASDLLERDRHLQSRGYWQQLQHPEMGTVTQNAVPVRLMKTPGSLRWAAPLLGQHTEAICMGLLGMGRNEYQELLDAEVLR